MTEVTELEEKRYEYQPKDEENRPIGAKQVIKYKTHEELAEKLAEQNTLLIRKLRSETRKNRLGILENEEIPDDAPKLAEPLRFTPRELSNDERVILSKKLIDPTTVFEATNEIIEASLGAPLKQFGETLQTVQADNANLRARYESDAFRFANPEYYPCEENRAAIVNWMLRYDLAPVKANFQKAYDTLKAQGIIVEGPAEVVEVIPIPVAVEPGTESGIPAVELPVTVQPIIPRVGSGFTREDATDIGVSPDYSNKIVYKVIIDGKERSFEGLAAINAMSGDDYRKALRDPVFVKLMDKLEKDKRQPRG